MDFNTNVAQVKLWLELGDIDAARTALDRVWALAGQVKARRTVAHDLGNAIQVAIFRAYEKSESAHA